MRYEIKLNTLLDWPIVTFIDALLDVESKRICTSSELYSSFKESIIEQNNYFLLKYGLNCSVFDDGKGIKRVYTLLPLPCLNTKKEGKYCWEYEIKLPKDVHCIVYYTSQNFAQENDKYLAHNDTILILTGLLRAKSMRFCVPGEEDRMRST